MIGLLPSWAWLVLGSQAPSGQAEHMQHSIFFLITNILISSKTLQGWRWTPSLQLLMPHVVGMKQNEPD